MLVGRQDALGRLGERTGAGRPVCVHGDLGIGKSALIRVAAENSGRPVLAGGGLASLSWSSYLPLMRAIRVPLPSGDAAVVASYVAHRVRDGLLVIDDLQYADRDTLAVLPALGSRVALLLAYRDGEPGSEQALAVARACGCELSRLEGLDDVAAAQLVRARNSRITDLEIRAIVATSGGNPLLLEEQARGPAGHLTIEEAIAHRLEGCSRAAREALALLALLGRPAAPALLDEQVLSELTVAGLLDSASGRVALRHQVVGRQAAALLDRAGRSRIHLRLARSLRDAGERARHLAAAGRLGEARSAALEAAETAPSRGECARHLGLAAECSPAAEGDDLRLRAAAALLDAGQPAAAMRVLDRVRSRERWIAGHAALWRARAQGALGDPAAAHASASAGLELAGAERSLALALRLERLRARAARNDGPGALLSEARELDELCRLAAVSPARAALALGELELAAGELGWEEALTRAIELARGSDEFDVECEAAHALIRGHLLCGRGALARQLAKELEHRCGDHLLRLQQVQFAARRLWLELHEQGAYGAVIEQCQELLADALPPPIAGHLSALLALALSDTGEMAEAQRVLVWAQARDEADRGRLLAWTQAEVALLAGETARACELALACLSDALVAYPVGALAALTLAWSQSEPLQTGRRRAGGKLKAPVPVLSYGGSEPELAGIASLDGEPLSARDRFNAAALAWSGTQRRSQLRCSWAQGEAARRGGLLDEAVALLRAAQLHMRESGLIALLAWIGRSLREAGFRESAGRSADALGLTAREREILDLVGQGLTSAAIARRLGLTPATVETHIESAREKLGAANRAQAAMMAAM